MVKSNIKKTPLTADLQKKSLWQYFKMHILTINFWELMMYKYKCVIWMHLMFYFLLFTIMLETDVRDTPELLFIFNREGGMKTPFIKTCRPSRQKQHFNFTLLYRTKLKLNQWKIPKIWWLTSATTAQIW